MSVLLPALVHWALLWLLALAVLRASYPLWRGRLLNRHPADAGDLLLAGLLVPLFFSAICVFALNAGTGGFLWTHCHGDLCGAHRPQIGDGVHWWLLAAVLVSLLSVKGLSEWLSYRRYRTVVESLGHGEGDWWVLPAEQPVAFTLGFWRPRLVASRALLEALKPQSLDVIAAHERAHRDRGDNFRALVARVALLPLLPLCRRPLEDLELCHEKACDLKACRVAEPTLVAQTIVDVARLNQSHWQGPIASFFGGTHSELRVRALLSDLPPSAGPGLPLGALALALLLLLLTLDPVHHLLEILW